MIAPLHYTMPKITQPLYIDHLPRFITDLLNFTSDGNVRQERHVTPAPSPGVAMSRLLIKAIDPTVEKIWAGLRAQLLALIASPGNWAAQITARTIGSRRANWAADAAAYAALPSNTRADWSFAAEYSGIKKTSILDTLQALHVLTPAQILFHVATGIWRIGIDGQPAQPAADNADAWAIYLFNQTPVYTDNMMALNGVPMSLGEDHLTL